MVLPAHRQAAAPPADLQQLVVQAAASGQKQIVIPPGTYRLQPKHRQHLLLENLNDVEIIAEGVELICTETTRALGIRNCRNLVLRGLTIDYDPLPFTQGRLVALSGDKRIHTIELMKGYPAAGTVKAQKYEIFDSVSRDLRSYTYHGIEVEVLGPRRIRVTKPPNYQPEQALEQVGDVVVINAEQAPGGSIPHAVVLEGCEQVTLDHITLYASNCFGFLETRCSGTRYLNCRVDRRPADTDLRSRETPRLRSLNADAFHSKFAGVGPVYRNCLARYMGDDGIAINGDYHLVLASRGSVLRVLGKNGKQPELAAGDPVELVDYSGRRLPDARVRSVEPGDGLTVAEKNFIRKQRMHEPMKKNLLDADRITRVVLDRAVELPRGSLLAAANRLGNGFEVSGCTIGPNRSRGILVKAGNGRITGNRLLGNWGEAIKVAPEYWWLEAGSSSHVRIEKNTISGCRDAAVAVYAEGGSGAIAPAGAHRNIVISGNRITGSALPGIAVTSTTGLVLKDNVIEDVSPGLLAPWLNRAFGRLQNPGRPVYLENVEDVTP